MRPYQAMRLRWASVLFLGGALGLCAASSGCGHSTASVAQGPQSLLRNPGGGSTPPFLAQIADAPFQNAYFARRRVWQTFQEVHGTETLEYTERVWSDGLGHFSVSPERLLQPALAPHSEQIFLLMQKAREGFIYRLRDFRIQELNAFLLAYQVQDLGQAVIVAGQSCERLRIQSVHLGQSYWEIDVDPSSGLILATREFLANGTLVSSVETLEFQANPNLSGITLHQDLPAVPFTPSTAQQVLGFSPLHPSFLPQGFALVKSEMISDGSANWARFCYSDGGETLFVLYRSDAPGSAPTADPAGPYTIKLFRAGRWSVAQGTFGPHHIITMGREPAAILQQVVESCLP